MGWVSKEKITDEELLSELKKDFPSKKELIMNVRSSRSGSVYEYLTDFIRDYYDVTLQQCDRVSRELVKEFGIRKIFYTD